MERRKPDKGKNKRYFPGTNFEVVRGMDGKPPPKHYDPVKAQAWELIEQENINIPAKGFENHAGWIKLQHLLGRSTRATNPQEARDASEALGGHLKTLKEEFGGK